MNVVERSSLGTGRANWVGLWAFHRQWMRRFLAAAARTELGPAVTTLLSPATVKRWR